MARRRATKRLLIVPALLFAGLIVGVTAIEGMQDRAPDAALRVDVPTPADNVELRRCSRDGDPQEIAELREALGPDPVVTSSMVVGCPQAFDGLRVRYAGELVGDLLHRRGGAWVLANDDPYALELGPLPSHGDHQGSNSGLSVWLPDGLVDEVGGLGRPDQRGDVVVITGVVQRTDPEDGGGLTIRAETLEVLARATRVDDRLDRPQAWFAFGASVLAAGIWVLRRRAMR